MPVSAQARAWRVRDLGNLQPTADWVDRHVGNSDGLIDENELYSYADRYGGDARHHPAIKSLALGLGFISVEAGGRVGIPRMGGAATNGGNGVTISLGGGMQVGISIGPLEARIESLGTPRMESTAVRSGNAAQIARRLVRAAGSAGQVDEDLVVNELAKVPVAVLRALERGGVSVRVCRGAVTEHRWELRGQHPRGHPAWATWDGVDGCYRWGAREITIATLGDAYGRRTLRANTVLHEVGHALDELGGYLSRGWTFRQRYHADIPVLQRNGQSYLLQGGDAGAEEAFAETFAWFVNHRNWTSQAYRDLYDFWSGREARRWEEFG